MNYQRIYNQIIERAKTRVLDISIYREKHHIVPKCMGGSDNKENLVELTAREHFLCHWLLARINPENEKLALAFFMMCKCRDRNQQRYTPSSKIYQEAKEQAVKLLSLRRDSEETRQKKILNNPRKGKPNWNTGIKWKKKGGFKPLPQTTKDAISKANKGKVKTLIICPYCSKKGGTPVMKRFHFENCKLKLKVV